MDVGMATEESLNAAREARIFKGFYIGEQSVLWQSIERSLLERRCASGQIGACTSFKSHAVVRATEMTQRRRMKHTP